MIKYLVDKNLLNLITRAIKVHSKLPVRTTTFQRKNLTNEFVYDVFKNVANKYDLMNDAMSLGIHRCWKDYFMNVLDPIEGTKLIDVAGGTGDIAFRFIDKIKSNNDKTSSVTVCDINDEMIRVGQKRAQELGYNDERLIKWVQGDAMKLPFQDNTFDAYTIAFGIRNVVNIDQALDEAFRVLKSGGIFLCLEFSQVKTPIFESVYDWYSYQIIPVLGEILAGDWKSYQYLVDSIRQFPDQDDFKSMIENAGFTLVNYENLMQGIAAIHSGFKK